MDAPGRAAGGACGAGGARGRAGGDNGDRDRWTGLDPSGAWVCVTCGLPMARNPHPDAGKPARLLEVGAVWVCVPCTVLGRHKASRGQREALDALEAERAAHAETLAALNKILPF